MFFRCILYPSIFLLCVITSCNPPAAEERVKRSPQAITIICTYEGASPTEIEHGCLKVEKSISDIKEIEEVVTYCYANSAAILLRLPDAKAFEIAEKIEQQIKAITHLPQNFDVRSQVNYRNKYPMCFFNVSSVSLKGEQLANKVHQLIWAFDEFHVTINDQDIPEEYIAIMPNRKEMERLNITYNDLSSLASSGFSSIPQATIKKLAKAIGKTELNNGMLLEEIATVSVKTHLNEEQLKQQTMSFLMHGTSQEISYDLVQQKLDSIRTVYELEAIDVSVKSYNLSAADQINLVVTGTNENQDLTATIQRIRKVLEQELFNEILEMTAFPELEKSYRVDREKARKFGVSTAILGSEIRESTFGTQIGWSGRTSIRLIKEDKKDSPFLDQLITFHSNSTGKTIQIPLHSIIDETTNPGGVFRLNGARAAVIGFFVKPGEGQKMIKKVNTLLKETELPEWCSWSFH
jgi:multidrug efflux pump subunit AcrB